MIFILSVSETLLYLIMFEIRILMGGSSRRTLPL